MRNSNGKEIYQKWLLDHIKHNKKIPRLFIIKALLF